MGENRMYVVAIVEGVIRMEWSHWLLHVSDLEMCSYTPITLKINKRKLVF